MRLTIRAHFDGRFIVPDEPVDLPAGQSLVAELVMPEQPIPPATLAERQAAHDRLVARAAKLGQLADVFSRPAEGPAIPDEALRREHMYDDADEGR